MTTPRSTMAGKPVFEVPAKTIINFKSHFDKKLLCDGMTFSLGSACVYSCSFCYVESMMKKQQEWNEKNGVTGDHFSHVVRRANAIEIARKQILSKSQEFRNRKQVIYASPLVDVAANLELVQETVEMCKLILSETNWDIRLLSKSNLLPKIAQGLEEWDIHNRGKSRVIYGVSTGTLDDKLAAAFEKGTPKVSKRIESIHWLQDNGYRTFGMICPSLPQDDYPKFAKDMAETLRVEKMEHCWAEIINVRGESFTRTMDQLQTAGYMKAADQLRIVSEDKNDWEKYARETFLAHTEFIQSNKLKFLQYVTKDTQPWWSEKQAIGAVLL